MAVKWPDKQNFHTLVFDFDGVFTDNGVFVNEEGQEWTRCSRYDGFSFNLMRQYQAKFGLNLDYFILSKEPNPVVSMRAEKLKLDCHQGINDKLTFMKQYLAEHHPNQTDPFKGLVYLGNDLNDLQVMNVAGLAVAPGDAHDKIKEVAHVVLPQIGGHGFVRAFVEGFLGIDQMSVDELNEFVSVG